MSGGAEYTFVPWVRDGYRPEGGDGTVRVELTVRGEGETGTVTEDVGVDLSLYGPGEVTGLDHRQVIRTEPTPGTSDFPPNHFPIVEFDRPELPWLFSPESADEEGQLRPWLCLITVEQTEGVALTSGTDGGGAVLDIGDPAAPADNLPDPSETWAWAHAQVVGDDDTDGALETDRGEKTLSRLLSPRNLDPQTDYYACVVPTYEAGRLAGLGEEPFEPGEGDGDGEEGPVAVEGDAWDPENPPGQIRLPVYYHWEFSTGKAGDFEALVRRLDPQVIEDVGVRQVDAGDPGPTSLENPGEVVSVEGALRSVDISPDTYGTDGLVDLLNEASALAPETAVPADYDADGSGTGDADDDRILGPPIYGQWQPAAPEIPGEDSEPDWLRDLNEDPRYRVPAAFGTDVVQDSQEQLMAEAWRQVGDIREANKLLRRARLARAASQQIHDQLATLGPAATLALSEPAHRRLIDTDAGRTIAASVDDSALPSALLSPAFRRITRPNGPLSRRLGGLRRERIVEDVNDEAIDLGDDGGPPDGAQIIDEDLAEELCTNARERSRQRPEWHFLGDAADVPLDEFVHEIRQSCQTVRAHADVALDALDPRSEEHVRLENFKESLNPICGHVGDDLTDLLEAAEEPDVDGIESALAQIDRWLSSADEHHEWLWTEADPSSNVEDLLDGKTELTPEYEAFRARIELLRLRLIVEYLFAHRCRAAHDILEELENDRDRVNRILAELRDLCAALCGRGTEAGGLLVALQRAIGDGDTERVREAVSLMGRILAIANRRLRRLSRLVDADVKGLFEHCEAIQGYVSLFEERLAEAPSDPVADAIGPRVCPRPIPVPDPPLDLPGTAQVARDGTDPAETIPDRIEGRLGGVTIQDRDDPLAQIMAHPEFDEPMYAALRDLAQENLVPGVGEIPLDSVGVLETNPPFVESYMLGLSHEMARELRWREYPTDLRGTYFRQFWDPEGRDPELSAGEKKDIDYVHRWDESLDLGGNYLEKMAAKGEDESDGDGDGDGGVDGDVDGGDGDDPEAGGRLVLVVRGALFDRYPNTHVYAAKGRAPEDGDPDSLDRAPMLPDPFDDDVEGEVEHPIFRGTLDPDVTFFGFDLDEDDALADPDRDEDYGWFFVIEEPPSGPSFGLDVDVERDEDADWTWEDLTWDDVTADGYVSVVGEEPAGDDVPADLPDDHDWEKNGAHMGAITWIRPFRAAIHADDMLPMDGGPE